MRPPPRREAERHWGAFSEQANFPLGEPAAKLFLADDGLSADEPQDLTVSKCFTDAHGSYKYTASCIFIQLFLHVGD